MTAAVCNSRFSTGGRRSIRAARMAWTVSGIMEVGCSTPPSRTAHASSSRKKGLLGCGVENGLLPRTGVGRREQYGLYHCAAVFGQQPRQGQLCCIGLSCFRMGDNPGGRSSPTGA